MNGKLLVPIFVTVGSITMDYTDVIAEKYFIHNSLVGSTKQS